MASATRRAAGVRQLTLAATRQGFLSGLDTILEIGAAFALVGAVPALWLVREHEIERDAPAGLAAHSELEYVAV